MRNWLLLSVMLSCNVIASEIIYLNCDGVVIDSSFNQEVKKVKNDFIINKGEKYIQQIITGMTEEQTRNLRHTYKESSTQFVTEDGFISINRHTLEYAVDGVMGINIKGFCKVMKPSI